jgi:hypothetical protein
MQLTIDVHFFPTPDTWHLDAHPASQVPNAYQGSVRESALMLLRPCATNRMAPPNRDVNTPGRIE